MQIWKSFKNSIIENRGAWIQMLDTYTRKHNYIKEFAFPYRRICYGNSQLLRQIMYFGCEKQCDCYLSLYNYTKTVRNEYRQVKEMPDYNSIEPIDFIFFDYDTLNAFNEADKLNQELDYSSIIYRTGRGIHQYIYLTKSYTLEQIVDIQIKITKTFNLKYVDKTLFMCGDKPIHDKTRVVRIPYTVNPKTNTQMIPLINSKVYIYDIEHNKFEKPDYRKINIVRRINIEEVIK